MRPWVSHQRYRNRRKSRPIGRDMRSSPFDRRCRNKATSGCQAYVSGRLSHYGALIIVDNVPPDPVRASPHDVARRAMNVHELAVRTCSMN